MADVISFAGAPKPEQVNAVNAICEAARTLRDIIDDRCPDCYEAEQAMVRLQEALMWANAAVLTGEDEEE